MPQITRPQVYRVVREMLPGSGSGRTSCCGGSRIRRIVRNGPGAPMPSAKRRAARHEGRMDPPP